MRIPGLEVCVARIEGADFVIPSLEVFPRRLGVGGSAVVRSCHVPGRRPGRESFLYMGSSAGGSPARVGRRCLRRRRRPVRLPATRIPASRSLMPCRRRGLSDDAASPGYPLAAAVAALAVSSSASVAASRVQVVGPGVSRVGGRSGVPAP